MVTSEEFTHRLTARALDARITVDAALAERLEAYYRLLVNWNQKINLTAIDLEGLPDSAIDRLLIEPLAAARFAPPSARAIDLGSGGGSPAIPFAIGAGASHLTMVESRARKSVFLKEAARVAGVMATVLTNRFEEIAANTGYHHAFDVLTIRAVRMDLTTLRGLRVLLTGSGHVFLFGRTGNSFNQHGAAAHQLCGDSELVIL